MDGEESARAHKTLTAERKMGWPVMTGTMRFVAFGNILPSGVQRLIAYRAPIVPTTFADSCHRPALAVVAHGDCSSSRSCMF